MKLIKDLGVVNGRKKGIYECSQCEEHIERRTSHVKSSKTTLCKACLMSNKMKTHGKTNTRLFRIWTGMKDRCSNPNNPEYQWYGDKGVFVYAVWKDDFQSFYDWAISNGYDDTKVLDKDILCDENNLSPKFYSPDTCLWVTPEENTFQANKSKVKEVYQFDLDDNFIAKYASQSEASRQTGISQGNIGQALKDTRTQSGGYKWKYQMN